MNLTGGEHVSYSQTTTHSQTTSHGQSDSRSSSYSSLGPANPIPSNYGSGNPPPFTPQAAVSYPEKSGGMPGSGMPGSGMPGAGMPAGGLVGGKKIENLNKNEFEEAKEKGAIPSWMVRKKKFIYLYSPPFVTRPPLIEIWWWCLGRCCRYWSYCLGSP